MRSNTLIVHGLIFISALMMLGCGTLLSPEDSEGLLHSQDELPASDVEEFEFCWWMLSSFFIHQDRLPQDPRNQFDHPGTLYKSVDDPYTGYIPPANAGEFFQRLTSQAGGIGIAGDSVSAGYVITDVVKNSPAEDVGLLEGDTLISVDGVSVAGISKEGFDEILAGDIGDTKELKIVRGNTSVVKIVDLGSYLAPTVSTDSLDSKTAVITLAAFMDSTEVEGGSVEEFRQALHQTDWAENIILDLRENGGGLVRQCVGIVSEFLPAKTPIVRVRQREMDTITYLGFTSDTVYYTIESEGLGVDKHLSILVNENTASASEMLVSALKEQLETVTIYGTRTYGKASGWGWFATPKNGVAIVTAMLITPMAGESYHETGIDPDVVVAESQDALDVAYKQYETALAKGRGTKPSVSWVEQLGPEKWMPRLILD